MKQWLTPIFVCSALSMASPIFASDLTLKRVMLSSVGMGYFEYEAQVTGDEVLKLAVGLDQVDDVLKSVVVFDDKGSVGGVNLPGREPLAQALKGLPFDASALNSPAALLQALRGAEVEVNQARGRIVSVNTEMVNTATGQSSSQSKKTMLTLLTEQGLQTVLLPDDVKVRFTDAALQNQVQTALQAMNNNRAKDARTLEVRTQGSGTRTVRVAYLAEVPLWKVAYRLVVPQEGSKEGGRLQGWAVLENMSGQDWHNVDLTLVSGQAVAFKQALYQSYYASRPEIPVQIAQQFVPEVDRGDMPVAAMAMAPAPIVAMGDDAMSPRALKKSKNIELASAATPSQAQESLSQVSYRFAHPVSVASGRSLSVPFADTQVLAKRMALYQPNTHAMHPLAATVLDNKGSTTLPAGIVTVYEQADTGLAFVGDAQLSNFAAGESRTLSFALDQKVKVDHQQSDTEVLQQAIVSAGGLHYKKTYRITHRYTVTGAAQENRQVVLEVPRHSNYQLITPAADNITQTAENYRVPVDVPAGKTQTLEVVQELQDQEVLALSDLVDREEIAVWLEAPEVDAQSKRWLQGLSDLLGKKYATQAQVTAQKQAREQIMQDQPRLRENIKTVPAGSALQKRYLATLNQQEDDLLAIAKREAQLTQAIQAADDAITQYLKTAP